MSVCAEERAFWLELQLTPEQQVIAKIGLLIYVPATFASALTAVALVEHMQNTMMVSAGAFTGGMLYEASSHAISLWLDRCIERHLK